VFTGAIYPLYRKIQSQQLVNLFWEHQSQTAGFFNFNQSMVFCCGSINCLLQVL